MVYVNNNDLKHILAQIEIAEQHAAGTPLTDLVANPLLPYGLRTVDGTLNNLTPGREMLGSADQTMPRLLDSTFLTSQRTGDTTALQADLNPRTGQPTSYAQTSGSVYDAEPRIISNLIADQTLANPAAVAAALSHSGLTGQTMLAAANEILRAFQNVRDTQAAAGNVDAALALRQAELQAAVDAAQVTLNAAQAEVDVATTAQSTADAAVTKAEQALSDASALVNSLQNTGALGEATAALAAAEATAATAQEALTQAQNDLSLAREAEAVALAARDAKQLEVDQLRLNKEDADRALTLAQTGLSNAQAELALQVDASADVATAQTAVTEAEGAVDVAQAAVDGLALQISTAQGELDALNLRVATAEAEVATANERVTAATTAAIESQSALDAAQSAFDTASMNAGAAQATFMAAYNVYVADPVNNFAQLSSAAAAWSEARAAVESASVTLTDATSLDQQADAELGEAQNALTAAEDTASAEVTQRDAAATTLQNLLTEKETADAVLSIAQAELQKARDALSTIEASNAAYQAAQAAVVEAEAVLDLAQAAADEATAAVGVAEEELAGLVTAFETAQANTATLTDAATTAETAAANASAEVSTAQLAVAAAQAQDTVLLSAMDALAGAVLDLEDANAAALDAATTLVTAQAAEVSAQTALDAVSADLAALSAPGAGDAALAAAQTAAAEAQATLDTLLVSHGIEMDGDNLRLPDVSPDEGLSAPYNSWMSLFGQFFDHGLDLVSKGGSGTVFIPLQPDDPLYIEGSPTNFMVLTRATNQPGPDGILGTADDIREHANKTTPWVDQNQTYTSHPSHHVFLREYDLDANGAPIANGNLLNGMTGGMSTWGDVKAQAASTLGIRLNDSDISDGPLLATDLYGNFIPGPNGLPQLVVANENFVEGGAEPQFILVEGNLADPVDASIAVRNGHAFLEDIAHTAAPGTFTNRITGETFVKTPDADAETGNVIVPNQFGQNETYDNELLDRHFIAGDGRGNENFGLTAVHHVFHSEHNRQVAEMKQTILDSGELDFVNQWLRTPITDADLGTVVAADLEWNGERLFQAARFATEMQYQHLAFEEFGRTVQPQIAAFVANASAEVDASIVAEFAHVVYRFGHSMLTENVQTMTADGVNTSTDLITAFLNPVAFDQDQALTADQAAGAVARGMSRETGSNIDEFLTSALRDNLVGLPLDLAALNIARGRETGVPSLNAAREQFYSATGSEFLKPYDNWAEFAANLKNPASIVNFIAAYGTHDTIVNASTVVEKRAAATDLVLGGVNAPADRLDFVNGTGAWAGAESGINDVEFWIGGLAEAIMPFGGMLGSSFGFVFQQQMEALQNGDRFYYLSRTAGMNMLAELENNSFASLIMRNTDIGEGGAHIPGNIFSSMDVLLEVDQAVQSMPDPVSTNVDPFLAAMGQSLVERATATAEAPLVDGVREYDNLLKFNGGEHAVLGGTDQRDILNGGLGDDTLWGDAGNDLLIGDAGVNTLRGGAGDDIVKDGDDISFLHGEEGNDVISAGGGIGELMFGGSGDDAILMGYDDAAEAFGMEGNDFIYGGVGAEIMIGGEGDDWIEGGDGFDLLTGDNGDPFGGSRVIGHDVLNGGANDNDLLGESGDDILIQGEGIHVNDADLGYDWIAHKDAAVGADIDLTRRLETLEQLDAIRDRYINAEAVSGTAFDDRLYGDDRAGAALPDGVNILANDATLFANELTQAGVDRIDGLRELLADMMGVDPADTFTGGNIMLGGAGSDLIQGRGGDDIIDGDKVLNVRISVRDPIDPTVELRSIDSLFEISNELLDGSINPGQLRIVREIVDAGQQGDVDVAVYFDVRANYNIRANADGSVTVEHINVPAAADLGTDPVNGLRNPAAGDGRDKLWNVEVLQFADGEVDLRSDPASTGIMVGTPAADTIDGTNGPDAIFAGAGNDQINGLAGNDLVFGEGGSDTFTWDAPLGGYDVVVGGGAAGSPDVDSVIINGDGTEDAVTMYTLDAWLAAGGAALLDPLSEIVVTRTVAGVETPILEMRGIEQVTLNNVQGVGTINAVGDFANTSISPNTIFVNGTAGDEVIDFAGFTSTQRIVVDAGDGQDLVTGGAGNDILSGGADRDTITWSVGGGSDVVDGGAGDPDTFIANGDASDELFRVYAADSWTGAPIEPTTEIVITRTAGGDEVVIAQLSNIEEIQINTGGGTNNVEVVGDFNPTSLNFNTITVNGTTGDDSVSIEKLASAHRVLLRSEGGSDTIVGTVREQDVIVLPEGTDLGNLVRTEENGVVTLSDGVKSVRFTPVEPGVEPGIVVAGTPAEALLVRAGTVNEAGVFQLPRGQIVLSQADVDALKYMITGEGTPPALPPENGVDPAQADAPEFILGVRDLPGLENNEVNPGFGAATEPFIRITEARYGEAIVDENGELVNRAVNPIFEGIDPRNVSNVIGAQEPGVGPAADANMFMMAFGQYFDHGLTFIPKDASNGVIPIGGAGTERSPTSQNPADLTRAKVVSYDENGVPQHENITSPFVDQNQVYGSSSLVGQLLRESDGEGGVGSKVLLGRPDPSNEGFNLLATLRELLDHHIEAGTVFLGTDKGDVTLLEYYPGLRDAEGNYDSGLVSDLSADFMGEGWPLLIDSNPYMNLLDHFVGGDGRANENVSLTAMHTIWARNHNYHVELLESSGFEGSAEELFQAAKTLNEAEYQQVVFNDFADALIGGLKGSGRHGHDKYDPGVDARISHEFAGAVYRLGHSLIGETLTILDANGEPMSVPLFDVFLNPTNDPNAFVVDPDGEGPAPELTGAGALEALARYGYVPQPGYAQYGVNSILGGMASQPSEEIDFNIVDAVRNDLVRINADLFAFNVARGWDLGLGTLNQVKKDLAASGNPYVQEAIALSGMDMEPYASWEDFQQRNGLSDAVVAQFKEAYPDLVLSTAEEITRFQTANPDIDLIENPDGTMTVKGIDRVDLWVGGLAEEHINGGVVGHTFWVVIHEQFDRLQEGDRFYYTDRIGNLPVYNNFIGNITFGDILARNTGMTDAPVDVFSYNSDAVGDDAGPAPGDLPAQEEAAAPADEGGDVVGETGGESTVPTDATKQEPVEPGAEGTGEQGGAADPVVEETQPMADEGAGGVEDTPVSEPSDGQVPPAEDQILVGSAGNDALIAGSGDDVLRGDTGDDMLVGRGGDDMLFGGDGRDDLLGGDSADMLFGGRGSDRMFGGDGDDILEGGSGSDVIHGDAGDDVFASMSGDCNDVYYGGEGADTLDLSAFTENLSVRLGSSGTDRGVATDGHQTDTLWSIENVVAGNGDDRIVAGDAENVIDGGEGNDTFVFESLSAADGDMIVGFQPGDVLCFSSIDVDSSTEGRQSFTLVGRSSDTGAGELTFTHSATDDGSEITTVTGMTDKGKVELSLSGHRELSEDDFLL